MHYLDFLAGLHERLAPRTYLEVGVDRGHSLALSRCPSVGIDPGFRIEVELVAPTRLIRATSDDYFRRLAARRQSPFPGRPIDLAFIDGMHLFEYALRDFVHTERLCASTSVVVFDDVLPRDTAEAARERDRWPWTGDVFRIAEALRLERPQLTLTCVDTEPTGALLVTGLDPASTTLSLRLDEIVREHVVPDPQPVPAAVLGRRQALPAKTALDLPLWGELAIARAR